MGKICDELIPIWDGNAVFDFVLIGGNIPITNYRQLKKTVVFKSDEGNDIELLDKDYIEIASIDDLEKVLLELVEKAVKILRTFIPDIKIETEQIDHRDFKELKVELLIEQLVFDILRDKYVDEAEVFNRHEYATYISKKLYRNESLAKENIDDLANANVKAIYENISGGMEKHYELMKHSKLRYQLELLGINLDKYDKYYINKISENSEKKKPVYVWNNYFFNFGVNMKEALDEDNTNSRGNMMITARQYKRQVDGKGRKYGYDKLFRDLKKYCELVDRMLPVEEDDDKKCFENLMEYYLLESYKRVDYMFKLVDQIPKDVMSKYELPILENFWEFKPPERFFLCERFCPQVIVPYEYNGNVEYAIINNYYLPLIKIEEAIIEDCVNDEWVHINYFKDLLQKHYYVRAKAYELFKYYYRFNSADYTDIKSYLKESYNMCTYHRTTGIWDVIKEHDNWEKLSKDMKASVRKRLRYFKQINDSFFWESSDRQIKK